MSHRTPTLALVPLVLASLALGAPPDEPPRPSEAERQSTVRWHEGDLPSALELARERGARVLLEFSNDGCGWCTRLREEALPDPGVARELAQLVCVRIDLTPDERGVLRSQEAADLGNRFGIRRTPTLVLLDPSGRADDVVAGFLPADGLRAELVRMRRDEGTRRALERAVAADPGDLDARWALANKLFALGDGAGHQAQMEAIIAADPERVSIPLRTIAINELREEMLGCMRGARPVDPAPLEELLAGERRAVLLYEGWSALGTVYRHLGRTDEMVAAWREAWRNAPGDEERSICGNALAWDFWEARDELPERERAFALRAARRAVDLLGDARGDDALRAAYLDTLACANHMNGETERAVELIEECRRLAPDAAEYAERLAAFRPGG